MNLMFKAQATGLDWTLKEARRESGRDLLCTAQGTARCVNYLTKFFFDKTCCGLPRLHVCQSSAELGTASKHISASSCCHALAVPWPQVVHIAVRTWHEYQLAGTECNPRRAAPHVASGVMTDNEWQRLSHWVGREVAAFSSLKAIPSHLHRQILLY